MRQACVDVTCVRSSNVPCCARRSAISRRSKAAGTPSAASTNSCTASHDTLPKSSSHAPGLALSARAAWHALCASAHGSESADAKPVTHAAAASASRCDWPLPLRVSSSLCCIARSCACSATSHVSTAPRAVMLRGKRRGHVTWTNAPGGGPSLCYDDGRARRALGARGDGHRRRYVATLTQDVDVRRRGRGFGAGTAPHDAEGVQAPGFERLDSGASELDERAARCTWRC